MNRDIKFRGKEENSNRWITGCLIQYESGDVAIFEKMITKYGYEATQITKRTKVNSDTIGQFTGHTDKNGKEIYEDDLLKTLNGTIVLVEWVEGGFKITNIKDTMSTACLSKRIIENLGLIVIGNIHDNPDLLED